MTMLIADPRLEEQLQQRRAAWGADHHDEVWEGVYFMTPLPNNETSTVVPLQFRLVAAKPRPKIEVIHTQTGQQWLL